MFRSLLAVAVLWGSFAVGLAHAANPPAEKKAQQETIRVATPTGTLEFLITDDTVVELDGRRCHYADVPDAAVIVRLEVSAVDDRTVIRVLFRTKK
jgi:hypothetical protein